MSNQPTTKQPKCEWRKDKNSDAWKVFGPASVVKSGATVSVTKKSGECSLEQISGVGNPFDVEGVPHVYGSIVEQADECIECGEKLYSAAQKRSGYCRPDCG